MDRAKGVFLWVYLVAQLLLEASSNREPLSELSQLVDSLPSELTALFNQILLPLQENQKPFRKTSELIELARASVKPIRVIELSFAEEADAAFAFGLAVQLLSRETEEARSELLRRRVHRLLQVSPRGEDPALCPPIPVNC
ncbi:hypothetical protein B0T25DRAFT_101774 [Lasiosphaeria hispida]|uniref:NACHT-NTPase and P-loop NTPases N-terminal domain-containing protein n=1 Tax=Lasiosphaeria hispida TaxID=260671 RepID=A0AAJ0MHQ8_9PEZI|nr:hypothetical protein B0T25DRAFT_101774 [Lasiosphaeria hispida]